MACPKHVQILNVCSWRISSFLYSFRTLKNFALTGAAGYIAPRYLKAIQDTGSQLVAALDKHDSVGIFDSYFQDCAFFTEYERFDRHLEKLRRE